MTTYTISKLGKQYGLSRSTLLYYDRIGLLAPSGRTSAGYRCYSEQDAKRLARICRLRDAGLVLSEIQEMLAGKGKRHTRILEKRLETLESEIKELHQKRSLLQAMLHHSATGVMPPQVDKKMWTEMLRAAGMDDEAMMQWHVEFEQRAPEGHELFLRNMGICEEEVEAIRGWAKGSPPSSLQDSKSK